MVVPFGPTQTQIFLLAHFTKLNALHDGIPPKEIPTDSFFEPLKQMDLRGQGICQIGQKAKIERTFKNLENLQKEKQRKANGTDGMPLPGNRSKFNEKEEKILPFRPRLCVGSRTYRN